jgi:hypothetical protein
MVRWTGRLVWNSRTGASVPASSPISHEAPGRPFSFAFFSTDEPPRMAADGAERRPKLGKSLAFHLQCGYNRSLNWGSSMSEKQITPESIPAFRFSRSRLAELAKQYGDVFRNNSPFPHVVIPNFLPKQIADAIAAEFPGPDAIDWLLEGPGNVVHSKDKKIEKLSSSNEEFFPPLTRHVMHEFNSDTMLEFAAELTGYKSLLPDPSYGGCGLHSTGSGGRLMIHADASRHPNPDLHQILNMIFYVTPDWDSSWGGDLELWDAEKKACVKKVKPEFNSMLIFFTGSRCFHGHPHPMSSPPGIRRNSLAVYYYTTSRPIDETYDGHQAEVIWVPTNELDKKISAKRKVRLLLQRILPPIVSDAMENALKKSRAPS